ncbi:glycoside hydrolase [Gloeopeniophorella convolvens]|nr:glycoside hydrolase [Gloeopeniophorella convolvens]
MRAVALPFTSILLLVGALPLRPCGRGFDVADIAFGVQRCHPLKRDASLSMTGSPIFYPSTTPSAPTVSPTPPAYPSATGTPILDIPLSTSAATTSIFAPASQASLSSSSGRSKYVFAHHIVGNTFPYTLEDWVADISLAHVNGIDGFALNVGSDSWQPDRVADAYQASLQSDLDFKLFISLDMSSLSCANPDDAATLRGFITQYATHPNQFIYDTRVFVSSFSGENCAFGQASPALGWASQFTQHSDLTGQNLVYFVPSFFVDPGMFSNFTGVISGALNWNSGWPVDLTTASADSVLSTVGSNLTAPSSVVTDALSRFVGSTHTDAQYIDSLNAMAGDEKRAYMATVSPWFFTHYSPQSFNKNFIYYTDDHLYSTRWDSIIAARDDIDLVEVLTWNDYGESHYIGPIEGAQPDSQAWVDGFNHTGWLSMTKYYATAFKEGQYPQIVEDKVYMWSRPHSRDAQAPDPVGPPSNFQLTTDTLWAVAMTTAPAVVTLSTGPENSQTFCVPSGMNKLSIPIAPGGIMHATIVRDGQTIVDYQPDGFEFSDAPETYNYNAFVAVSN